MMESINNSPEMVVHLQALVERDKALLARGLHDELGGYLIAASMDIEELGRRLTPVDTGLQLKLRRVKSMLDASIDFTRRLTEELQWLLPAFAIAFERWGARWRSNIPAPAA